MNGGLLIPSNVVFGYRPEFLTAPIRGLPADTLRVRRRVRADNIMSVFAKTPRGVFHYRRFLIEDGVINITEDTFAGGNVTNQ